MATPKSQRIGILIIAVVMVVGTIGSFAVMVLATRNQQDQSNSQQAAYEEYQADIEAQNAQLSEQYYPVFSEYSDLPKVYSRDSVTKLVTKDLRVGDGETVADETLFVAYYIGWNSDGTVFDQSIDNGALKAPFPINGLATTSVIEGWQEGLVGMKLGGVRLLEIPSDKAYGEKGSGDKIPPNEPLKFVVMAVEQPEAVPVPPLLLQGAL